MLGRSNMSLDLRIFKRDLAQALDTFDAREASRLVGQLIDQIEAGEGASVSGDAGEILDLLRRKRRFDLMESLAKALRAAGVADAKVQRQHAQALIDQKVRLLPALGTLSVLRTEIAYQRAEALRDLDREDGEALGLIGRTYKQLYVNGEGPKAIRPAYLRGGIDAYLSIYEGDPEKPIWHGINVVALLCRAERDGITLGGYPDPLPIAEEILGRIEGMSAPGPWGAATAMEACIALNRTDDAVDWLGRYLSGFEASDEMFANADAFELGSTLRQLEEVWNLRSDSSPGSDLLGHLRAALLGRDGGRVGVSAEELRSARTDPGVQRVEEGEAESGYEKNFGLERFRTPKWLQMALSRAQCVAKISDSGGAGFGTGFVIDGGQLHESYAGTTLLVTNSHVISADEGVRWKHRPLWPHEAHVSFEMRADDREWVGTKVLRGSPPDELDFAIVELSDTVPIDDPYPVNQRALATGGTERIYIIRHPKGESLKYSFDDNHLLEMNKRLLRYRTPTEGGSSGSPVFDSKWQLVGLHHFGKHDLERLDGKGTYDANEGIWVGAIREALG